MSPRLPADATWLVPGDIAGEVVRLDEPLSFWGGFDATTGCVIDRSHPQHGTCVTGKVIAMPGTRGSSGSPGVLGESLRLGTGPTSLLVTAPDVNLVAGAIAAAALYDVGCPVLLIDQATFDTLTNGTNVSAAPPKEQP